MSLELPVAGIGFRALAYLIDVGLLFAAALVTYFGYSFIGANAFDAVSSMSTWTRTLGVIAVFAALWCYWTVLEVRWRGQTVGKRVMGIRVVRSDGTPVGPFESAIRNLLRLIDFFPVCYPVGVVCMLVDPRHRRLGDIVAGTVLVREASFDVSRYSQPLSAPSHQVSDAELAVVSTYLHRFDSLDLEAKERLGRQLASRLGIETHVASTWSADELKSFLASLGADATTRSLVDFVRKRSTDWTALEQLLTKLDAGQVFSLEDVSRLDVLYRRASAALAQAQTHYPATDVHRYLNQLCGRAFGAIYQGRGARLGDVVLFFRTTFPQAARESLRYTQLAAIFLTLGAVLGATTVAFSPNGADVLLSPTLLDHIRRQELWTDLLLEQLHPAQVATEIFTNNLRVSFSAFATGITAGIGTVLLLVLNGIHVGAIVAACAQHEVAGSMLSFMSAHGPVELSIIAMTGGAGLMMAHGLIEPKDLSRPAALRLKAKQAIILVLGCAPFLVVIGIVEGFVSPGSFFPWPLKASFGAISGVAFWRYLLGSSSDTDAAGDGSSFQRRPQNARERAL